MNTDHGLPCASHLILLSRHRNPEGDTLLSSFYKWDQRSEKFIIFIGCSKKSKLIHQALRSFHRSASSTPACNSRPWILDNTARLSFAKEIIQIENIATTITQQELMLKLQVGCPAWRRALEPYESKNSVFFNNYPSQEYIQP